MAAQPRVTDFIPRRPLSLVLLVLAALSVIAGLEALYYWMPRVADLTTDGRIAAFDLDSEGSLGAWFSSLLLLTASVVCLLIWSLRRHKLDDYHGRYRIWFYAAAVWFVMSIDEACSLHEGFKELMSHATGQRIMGDGSLWWIIAYTLVLGGLGIRLLLEMRPCRTSTGFFLATGLAWCAAVAWQLELVMPASGARGVMVEEGAEMLGDVLLLLALLVHARYVIMEVEGELPSRKKSSRRRKSGSGTAGGSNDSASQPSAGNVQPSSARTAAMTAAASKAGSSVQRIDPPESRVPRSKLSKAERRAQRRLARQRDE